MNWFPFHIGDHYKRTAHLSACEEGIHVRLVCLYLQNGPLGDDLTAIQRRARARSKEERAAVGTVLKEAFTFDSEGRVWRSKECDELIRSYQEKSAKAQQSAKARWSDRSTDANASKSHQPSDSEGNANASKSHAGRSAIQEPESRAPESRSHSPITNSQEDTRARSSACDAMYIALKELGVNMSADHPTLVAWVGDGYTLQQVRGAFGIAQERKGENERIPPNYIDTILREEALRLGRRPRTQAHDDERRATA